jgi:CDP-4-dehydro-6-deoxyglucose reductase, E3
VRTALSEIELEIEDLGNINLAAPRTLPCRIQALEPLASDVLKVVLRLPPGSAISYRPGQYVDVIGHGGLRRSYSIANAPAAHQQLELHVRRVDGGAMSNYWFGAAQANDLLRLHGPLGTFFLRDVADLDLVFLATGTGIAPVKAMLEGLGTQTAAPRSVTVYWGGRVPADLYWDTREAGTAHRFVPVLSRAGATWDGARGHVQDLLLAEGRDWGRTFVYACGSDAMIHDARRQLVAAGLGEGRFFSDAFVCSAAA